jgi:hypothetical protein
LYKPNPNSNQVSEQILNDLSQLNWPFPKEGFIFKKYYLVKKDKK